MTAFVCTDCDSGPIGPDEANQHDALGHDVRRLEDRWEESVPEDPGHVNVWRGERVGRRRSDY